MPYVNVDWLREFLGIDPDGDIDSIAVVPVADLAECESCGHRQAEPNWCHQCGHRTAPPKWMEGLLVVQRQKCPTCEGDGTVRRANPDDRFYVNKPCPICHGKRYVPDEWATVDGCLDWLRERFGARCGLILTDDGCGVWVPGHTYRFDGPTLHDALIAACVAVQEAGQ
jgi:hypothetical protein